MVTLTGSSPGESAKRELDLGFDGERFTLHIHSAENKDDGWQIVIPKQELFAKLAELTGK